MGAKLKMARLHSYDPKPATLRRELTQDLAKALAYWHAKNPGKANTWAGRLARTLIARKILRGSDALTIRRTLDDVGE
jgi:hypothetical protein